MHKGPSAGCPGKEKAGLGAQYASAGGTQVRRYSARGRLGRFPASTCWAQSPGKQEPDLGPRVRHLHRVTKSPQRTRGVASSTLCSAPALSRLVPKCPREGRWMTSCGNEAEWRSLEV